MVLVKEIEARRFVRDAMCAAGCSSDVGERVAELLVGADRKGHKSHGMNRSEEFIFLRVSKRIFYNVSRDTDHLMKN